MNAMMIKACFTFCLAMLTFFLFILGYKNWKLQKQHEIYETQLELQNERMGDIEKYWKEVSALLESIRKDLEAGTITEELLTCCGSYATEFVTGVEVVDALVGYKKRSCQQQNIVFSADIKMLPENLFSDAEYIGLLGNLLDNAIEAAAKTACPEVKIECAVYGGQWILKVVNSKRKDAKPLVDNLATTKGSGHGIGTKIISRIVKRHGGVIEYNDEGERFRAMAVFRI